MPLSADEFIRRFLLHVLPDGFHRIRYYGFLGNRYRQEKLETLSPTRRDDGSRDRAAQGLPRPV
jgi:hypothetical protein